MSFIPVGKSKSILVCCFYSIAGVAGVAGETEEFIPKGMER
jgi:hypothetical protein